jgi:CheY-like chemotaxis protein
MEHEDARRLLERAGVLGHPCDLEAGDTPDHPRKAADSIERQARRMEVSAAPSEQGQDAPLVDLTILVVEDTEDSRDATRMILEFLGAEVLAAKDGIEALAVMATSSPDLVLCDLRMPRMDGFEFVREVSRIYGEDHPPVVAVSGLASKSDLQRTQAAGFDGHLNKPFDDKALVSAVRTTLDHRRPV